MHQLQLNKKINILYWKMIFKKVIDSIYNYNIESSYSTIFTNYHEVRYVASKPILFTICLVLGTLVFKV